MNYNIPSKEAIEEAQENPGGYVYMIDEEFRGKEDVPPYAIIGYWRVNDKGVIHGPFVHNPNHSSKLS